MHRAEHLGVEFQEHVGLALGQVGELESRVAHRVGQKTTPIRAQSIFSSHVFGIEDVVITPF